MPTLRFKRRTRKAQGARKTRRRVARKPLFPGLTSVKLPLSAPKPAQPQHQEGGGENKAVVFVLANNAGFFSTFFIMCKAYLYAKDKGYAFFIDHNNWQYTYQKGWHDYFTSLQPFHPTQEFSSVEKYSHPQHSLLPDYTVAQYRQAIKEIFVLKQEYQDKINKCKREIGSTYTALYVRRGDKVNGPYKEMELLTTADILAKTDIRDDGRTIFVQTDDYGVLEEVQKAMPSCKLESLTAPTLRGSYLDATRTATPEDKKKHTEELLISTGVVLGGSTIWTDVRSNVGRFHKLAEYDKTRLYPSEQYFLKLSQESIIKPYDTPPL